MTLYRDLLWKIYITLALLIAAACGLGATMVGNDLPGMREDGDDAPLNPATPPGRAGRPAVGAPAGRPAAPDIARPVPPPSGR